MSQNSDLDLPLAMSGGWKRRIKIALGSIAGALLPKRVREIAEGRARFPLTRLDHLLIAAMVHRASRSGGSLDHLAYLHRHMWEGDVTAYHTSAEGRFATWFLPHQSVVVDALERSLGTQPGRFHTVCEIGTGSGVTLDYLQRRLAAHGVTTCIGLDLSPAQVQATGARFPACRFVAGDANTWIPEHAGPGWIIFCCGGVLEYFPRVMLERLFAQTQKHCVPVRWVIVEPVDPAHDLLTDTTSRLFGFETTWSHPYPHLLRLAGMTVFYEHELRIDHIRWHLIVAGS